MPPVNFERLRDRRDELDLSNEELAERVGLSQGFVENILYGSDQPSGRVIHRLARALGLAVEEIKGSPTPQGDPSEPPEQPKQAPKKTGRKESAGKAPKRVDDVRAAS